MCGIVGIILRKDVESENSNVACSILDGLQKLEYRGYDSAGLVVVDRNSQSRPYVFQRRRAEGKISILNSLVENDPLCGTVGIGHTRWATHGRPSVANAHPQICENVAVVHNGVIENYKELKHELEDLGYIFYSETDTEVISSIISYYFTKTSNEIHAVQMGIKRLKGVFALGIIFLHNPNVLIGVQLGSSLVIGYAPYGFFLSSDSSAFDTQVDRACFLEDGDMVVLNNEADLLVAHNQLCVNMHNDKHIYRHIVPYTSEQQAYSKGHHKHFMCKEIHEQAEVLGYTFSAYTDIMTRTLKFDAILDEHQRMLIRKVKTIVIVACGTSYYAGMVACYWMEKFSDVSVVVYVASEFRALDMIVRDDHMYLFVSQSGETADTLSCMKDIARKGGYVFCLVNRSHSSMTRLAHCNFMTYAGSEIGVASTKVFSCQMMFFAIFSLYVGHTKKCISTELLFSFIHELYSSIDLVARTLRSENNVIKLAHVLCRASNVLYAGRFIFYPLALEGALKLKEVSYIHAEGLAIGELKHGPIALIDEKIPTVVLAPFDQFFFKTISNVQEIQARCGPVLLITCKSGMKYVMDKSVGKSVTCLEIPECTFINAPFVVAVSVQLLAYHVAVLKGTDVDQPRNLAKSVTVE